MNHAWADVTSITYSSIDNHKFPQIAHYFAATPNGFHWMFTSWHIWYYHTITTSVSTLTHWVRVTKVLGNDLHWREVVEKYKKERWDSKKTKMMQDHLCSEPYRVSHALSLVGIVCVPSCLTRFCKRNCTAKPFLHCHPAFFPTVREECIVMPLLTLWMVWLQSCYHVMICISQHNQHSLSKLRSVYRPFVSGKLVHLYAYDRSEENVCSK